MVKLLPTMWETQIESLGQEDLLEKEMATHSSILAWKIHGQRSLEAYSPWGHKESDTTEGLHFPFHFPCYKDRMYLDQVLPFKQRPSLTQFQNSFQLSSSTSCIYPRKLNAYVCTKTH